MEKFELRKRYKVEPSQVEDALTGVLKVEMSAIVSKSIEDLEKMLDAEIVALKMDMMVELRRIKNATKS